MSLVVVACPQTEAELACMLCELRACGIGTFVQGGGFGSLWPGAQIAWYNARRIMVASGDVVAAREVLAPFTHPAGPREPYRWPGVWYVLRIIAEMLLAGWCVPVGRRRRNERG